MTREIICVLRFLLDAFWYVPKFALEMRMKIWKNRYKYITGHWKKDPAERWLKSIVDEAEELREAMLYEIKTETTPFHNGARKKRRLEAVDVANFAMMAAYADEID